MPVLVTIPDHPDMPPRLHGRKFTIEVKAIEPEFVTLHFSIEGISGPTPEEIRWIMEISRPAIGGAFTRTFSVDDRDIVIGEPRLIKNTSPGISVVGEN